ncbi:antichymotrypsin-2 [Teleopsis dalmanni]|uniref:antichymotrypsin-2 n=1 Tax=Teleopsis dalmanni TaxID=139649 RepID=UPI0018CF087F|nr:antichymotrypsin-2 [Teleopsis dalmanni]
MANSNNGVSKEINFSTEIFNRIASAYTDHNIIISPLLLEATLALLYLGSDGSTAEELKQLLQLSRFSSNSKMANYFEASLAAATQQNDTKIFLSIQILLNENLQVAEEFQTVAKKYFQTATATVDMKSEKNIRGQLNESVNKICKPSGTSLLSVLTAENAVNSLLFITACFQNKWFLPFSAYRSGIYDFYINGLEPKEVPMLFDDDMFVKFAEFRELDARAIELPFEHDDELAMLLVLPNKRDGLTGLLEQLKTKNLVELTECMQMESVQILLPKFNIDFECSLRTILQKMGLGTIFSNTANFKNLVNENCTEQLSFTDLFHEVSIAVNESGSDTSPVATNKPIVISNSIDSRQKFFRADHPFFFAVTNRDVTYFAGQVIKF